VVVPQWGPPAAPALIAEFARRYGNAKTRQKYEAELAALFTATGRHQARQLAEADVLAWCAGNGHLHRQQHRPQPPLPRLHLPALVCPDR
jgi:hypothetical protein